MERYAAALDVPTVEWLKIHGFDPSLLDDSWGGTTDSLYSCPGCGLASAGHTAKKQVCKVCKGDTECKYCDGTGSDGEDETCSSCGGSGCCANCDDYGYEVQASKTAGHIQVWGDKCKHTQYYWSSVAITPLWAMCASTPPPADAPVYLSLKRVGKYSALHGNGAYLLGAGVGSLDSTLLTNALVLRAHVARKLTENEPAQWKALGKMFLKEMKGTATVRKKFAAHFGFAYQPPKKKAVKKITSKLKSKKKGKTK